MAAIKRFFEWYLAVPPAEPGQGTRWQWSFQSPWPAAMPPWLVTLCGVLLVVAVVAVYRRDAGRLARRARLVGVTLRLTTVAVVLLFLSGAAILIQRTGLPLVAVLIDTSASMSLEDRYPDPGRQARVSRLAGRRPATRLALVQSLLAGEDGRWLRELGDRFQVRVYAFDQQVRAVAGADRAGASPSGWLAGQIDGLKADGQGTRPGPAVLRVLQDFRGSPPAAIVVLTDGIASTSDADRLSTAAPAARRQLVPIFTVAAGSHEPARDLHLQGLRLDEIAFVDDPLVIAVTLKAFGFAGRRVTLRLRSSDSSEPLLERTVVAAADGKALPVELTWVPPQEGDFDLVVEAVPLAGETNQANNSQRRHLRVRREKVRVLLADGYPRWEYRYVKGLLERDASIALTTVLQDADPEFTRDDRAAREHFPVDRDELFEFDVIILGDINPQFLSTGIMQNLRDFVREARGGILLVAGTAHNPLGFRGTPLEVLVPAELASIRVPDAAGAPQSWTPRLTVQGQEWTSLFRLAGPLQPPPPAADGQPDPAVSQDRQDRQVLAGLPPFQWLLEIDRPKPGAVALLECRQQNAGATLTRPAILLQHFGAGTVLFHATDELWRWRFRAGDRYYGRYWLQAVRFLGRARLLGQTRDAELSAGRSEYALGETARLQLRFFNAAAAPPADRPPLVRVQKRGGSFRDVTLEAVSGSPGTFEGRLENAAAGGYHAWVREPVFSDAPPATDFRVTLPDHELRQRAVDTLDLEKTARLTHGKSYLIDAAEGLADALPPGRSVPLATDAPIRLWNRPELLLLFACCLAGEWLWRRRWRLL